MRTVGGVIVAALLVRSLGAQFVQQGPMLYERSRAEGAYLGTSVAVSADGGTIIAGEPGDDAFVGAAAVWVLASGVWRQEGDKLVGAGAAGPWASAGQGRSVALSSDGNTALIGGDYDDSGIGAAWVFTRSNGVWEQQGSKLVGVGGVGSEVWQGHSVALSATGDTAILGGPEDNVGTGAAWVFTRSNGVWALQGSKLTASDAAWGSRFGCAASLSADGNTALIGTCSDDWRTGGAWVFTRSNGVWSQQGSKLVGTGGAFAGGISVALSADGDTAMVGGGLDATHTGGAWIFTRSNGVWSQQGDRLVGSTTGPVALSGDGNTAVMGGPNDDGGVGAIWVFTRTSGAWAQQGSKLVGAYAEPFASVGSSVAISGDGRTAVAGAPQVGAGFGGLWVFSSSVPLVTGKLAFVQQPTSTVAGHPISPAVTVQFEDSAGSPVEQAAVRIDLSLASGPGQLGGSTIEWADASGRASFDNFWSDLIGTKTLTASSPGVAPAVSEPFVITIGQFAGLVATGGTSQSALLGTPFSAPLQVMATDGYGNPVSGVSVTFTAPASGPSVVLSDGGVATTAADGRASVRATANTIAGGPYIVWVSTSIYYLDPMFSLTNLGSLHQPRRHLRQDGR